MSNYVKYGTLTTDTSTTGASVSGYVTMSAHLDSGSGTLTWEFKGPDGVWRTIYNGTTAVSGTASHMNTVYFGCDVKVRATGSGGTSPVWDWQIMSAVANRLA